MKSKLPYLLAILVLLAAVGYVYMRYQEISRVEYSTPEPLEPLIKASIIRYHPSRTLSELVEASTHIALVEVEELVGVYQVYTPGGGPSRLYDDGELVFKCIAPVWRVRLLEAVKGNFSKDRFLVAQMAVVLGPKAGKYGLNASNLPRPLELRAGGRIVFFLVKLLPSEVEAYLPGVGEHDVYIVSDPSGVMAVIDGKVYSLQYFVEDAWVESLPIDVDGVELEVFLDGLRLLSEVQKR